MKSKCQGQNRVTHKNIASAPLFPDHLESIGSIRRWRNETARDGIPDKGREWASGEGKRPGPLLSKQRPQNLLLLIMLRIGCAATYCAG
jgi:hypothetical protein